MARVRCEGGGGQYRRRLRNDSDWRSKRFGNNLCLHPKPNGGWAIRVIHTFTGGADGSSGSAGKILLRGGHHLRRRDDRRGEWCRHGLRIDSDSEVANGISRPFIHSRVPRTGFSLTALCFLMRLVISTARLTTAERMTWVQFTSCRPAASGSGTRRCFTASRQGAMETVRSAILSLMQQGIFTAQPAKVDWAAARFSN